MKAVILSGIAALASLASAKPTFWWPYPTTCTSGPFTFTSTYNIVATPEQVVEEDFLFTGGLPGAIGYYNIGLNSALDMICWSITLVNFQGDYESPARTATHIHEAAFGIAGPPRFAFPNPRDNGDGTASSVGCRVGPFRTGLDDEETGVDTGVGFTVAMIEANPTGYMADVHSSLAVPGAVRGQFAYA